MSTVTSEQSWGSRVGGAFKGIVVGLVLVVVGIALLFWNEGRTIKQTKNLNEGAANVIDVDADTLTADNEGKLVHISGDAITDETLADPFFDGVQVNALKLNRKVEIYQWIEESETKTERGSGGKEITTTTYSYHKDWQEGLIDSSNFHDSGHDNPTSVPVESQQFVARNVKVGAFTLSSNLIDDVSSYQDFNPKAALKAQVEQASSAQSPDEAANVPSQEAAESEQVTEVAPDESSDGSVETPSETPAEAPVSGEYQNEFVPDDYDEYDSTPDPVAAANANDAVQTINGFTLTDFGFYRGNQQNPLVGDVKVTFTTTPSPTRVSIVSEQRGDSFVPYKTKTGEVELLCVGDATAAEMFASAQSANKMMAWLLRLAGFLAVLVGFNMLFAPLSVLADIVPIASSIVGVGAGIVAFCLSLCVSLLTIAIGWIAYRPFLACVMIALGIAIVAYPIVKKRRNAEQKA